MSDQMKPGDNAAEPQPAQPAAPDAAAEAASAEAAATAAGGGKPEVPFDQLKQIVQHLQKEIDEGQAKIEDAKNEKLRLIADMDNLRKRTEREKEDMAKYAVTRFAQDIVGVIDNFERAAAAVPAEAAEKDATLKSFLEGVLLAERDFVSVLSRHGVRQIEARGQPFNPHQHQAVMERDDASVPSGTVLQVFQAGYMIEDRCLRPAMVVVSKGGAKTGKAGPADNGDGTV